jgi:hypothetical protein
MRNEQWDSSGRGLLGGLACRRFFHQIDHQILELLNSILNGAHPLFASRGARRGCGVCTGHAQTSLCTCSTGVVSVASQSDRVRFALSSNQGSFKEQKTAYFLCRQRLQENCGRSRRLLEGKRALPLAVFPGPHSGSRTSSWPDIVCCVEQSKLTAQTDQSLVARRSPVKPPTFTVLRVDIPLRCSAPCRSPAPMLRPGAPLPSQLLQTPTLGLAQINGK